MVIRASRWFLPGLLSLCAAAPAALPQDVPAPEDPWRYQYAVSTDHVEGGTFIRCMAGNVGLDRGSLSVQADRMVVWMNARRIQEGGERLTEGTDPKEEPVKEGPAPPSTIAGSRDVPEEMRKILGPELYALYAEGGVVFRLGTRTLRTDRLYVDFQRNLLTTGRVEFSTSFAVTQRGETLPLILRGERMRRVSVDSLRLEEGSYTTCSYFTPHWEFRYREFLLTDEADHTTLTGYRNVLDVEGVPIFYLPVVSMRSDASSRPLQSVAFSSSSRFGQELDVTWGDDILWRGGLWGQWRLRTDYRSQRGPGIGPELEYDTGGAKGQMLAYWQRDLADRDDYNDAPVPREERGRLRWEHRQRFSSELRLDLSLWHLSDPGFQPEFLKKEYLEERDPESYAYLRWARRNDLASLSVKERVDDFRTETTELPEAAFHRIGAPVTEGEPLFGLLDGLTYSADVTAGVYERKFDEALGLHGDREMRQDAALRLEGHRWAGPISIAPFALAGATLWQGLEEGGRGGGEQRSDLALGVRATLEARREWPDAASAFFGWKGLRHVAELQGLWYDRAVTADPIGATAADRLDDLDEIQAFELRFRNRLQAWRGGRRVDWIDWELRGYHFPGGPGAALPPLRFKEEGIEGPRFSDLAGEEKYRASPLRGPWGPYEGDLRILALENVFLLGEGEYDPYERHLRTSAAGMRWFVIPSFSLYAGNRRIAGDSNIVTLSADWAVSDRWMIHTSQQVDYRKEGRLNSEIGIRRLWHDFVMQFDLENDRTTGEFSVRFEVIPSFLWTAPTSAERLGRLDPDAQRWYR